ncbi:phenylacetic acid degradation protein PaaN [Sansalvadorimonas sp. 2012CJ34-2]|uniref:Phenylacetic acid degradation protein PaaN n=1 Tax=Parendozoicomonas callyspongiae TaxID=2942213 RepID=A0ABT0PKN8_9GAMM|nr:phenylacetic acid degradation protein PaaN [Sansalvadorimonas sp. 2012CJ34-2]MCL6271919.1 phenylacetic acid degradation protein PaaN [Sansalvadorimonas sp. 2012CJ34-2]
MSVYFEKHQEKLEKALDACLHRYAWTAYKESPSSKIHGTEKPTAGKESFQNRLNKPFRFSHAMSGQCGETGAEVSPYTQKPLGITYPKIQADELYPAVQEAMNSWRKTDVQTRVGLCMEMLERCADQLFENAHATMHTSGQSFIMAFAGSGANALDRGLEALAYAYKAMKDVPVSARWERRFGAEGTAALEKEFRIVPVGVSVAVCCATFPLWNGCPALMASLATGNPVVMKPHPSAILPVALVVEACREVLVDAGFDPNLVTMVADTRDEPATMPLLEHPDTAIIDFTGSPGFGQWIEDNCRKAQVYTETAGCNSVVIESTDDLHGMTRAIAHSLCQASAQMCTSVQNIHIPADGIRVKGEQVSFDEIANQLVEAVEEYLAEPKMASFLCGALVTDEIYATLDRMQGLGIEKGKILRSSGSYNHPDFPDARTATPLIIEVTQKEQGMYRSELFGPVSFVIKGEAADDCLAAATKDARECGAITSHIYSVDDEFLEKAQDAYNDAGASVACNLMHMPINFAAAYSDYHVTGLNPAGNACLTDLAFVTRRFRVVQRKKPASQTKQP